MKNIIKFVSIIFILVLFSGCAKDYKKLTYTAYNEYFNAKKGYVVLDHSTDFGLNVIRSLEAGNGDIQIMYMEFSDDKEAINYIKKSYDNTDKYKVKMKDDYSIIKSNKGSYFKLYRVDNIIVYGMAQDKKNKKEVNNILKDLGY